MGGKPIIAACRAVIGRIDATLDLVPGGLVRLWAWLQGAVLRLWVRVLPVLQVLFYCRFSVLVVTIAAFLLWFSDQGKEISIRVGDDLFQSLLAVVGTFFWAFHSWFDGRRVLTRRFGNDRGEAERGPAFKRLVERIPRLIGSAAYLVAASSAFIAWYKLKFQSGGYHGLLLFLDLVFAVLFFYLMKGRTGWQRWLLGAGKTGIRDIAPWVMRITWTYGIALFLLATFIPVRFGFFAGSLAITFFALSTIVSFGSWLILETTRDQQQALRNPDRAASTFPVILALFVLAVILTIWPYNDNHRLPTLSSPSISGPIRVNFSRPGRARRRTSTAANRWCS